MLKEKDVERYLEKYNPVQLRCLRTKKVNLKYRVKNFGESKGATYERVLIYPTQKIMEWVLEGRNIDSFETKCKFYVAITRAQFSVAIVCKNNVRTDILPFAEI